MSAGIINKASNLTTSTITLVVPKTTLTNIVKNNALIHKYTTESFNGLATSPTPNKAPSIRIIGSVPTAIKPPINVRMKTMLAINPTPKNKKFEARIKIEKYNKVFFISKC